MSTTKELEAKIAALEATIEANKPTPKTMTIKVSETTGCIVVGGLTGRYPISLFQNTWKALYTPENATTVLEFIDANQDLIDKYMKAAGKTNQ